MGTQKMSGLTKRGGTWHIDKVFRGTRIRESTGTGEIVKAQELLAKRIDEIRAAQLYGARPDRTFRAAATKFLNENQHKRSIDDDALHLAKLDPFIGSLFLKQVHLDSVQPFIASRRADGVKTTTINLALGTVRRILNLAASEWRDERGMTWLEHAAKITKKAQKATAFANSIDALGEAGEKLARKGSSSSPRDGLAERGDECGKVPLL